MFKTVKTIKVNTVSLQAIRHFCCPVCEKVVLQSNCNWGGKVCLVPCHDIFA